MGSHVTAPFLCGSTSTIHNCHKRRSERRQNSHRNKHRDFPDSNRGKSRLDRCGHEEAQIAWCVFAECRLRTVQFLEWVCFAEAGNLSDGCSQFVCDSVRNLTSKPCG